MAEYSHLSDPDPEFAPYMAQLLATPQIPDLEARRARFDAVFIETSKKSYSPGLPKDSEYVVKDHQFEVTDGKILVRSLIPASKEGSDNTYPLMVWMHGGGWTSGSIELDDYQLRAICVQLQISILNVDYRLAPENPHPTGLNDSYAVLKWAAGSPELFSADLKKSFIVAGLSAGAHFAAVIAYKARDDQFFHDKKLTGVLLQVPPVLNPNAVRDEYFSPPSMTRNFGAPLLHCNYISETCPALLGGNPADPEISPLLYPSQKGLVPTVIQVCGLDPLRDEAFLYEKLLKDEGVKTKITVYPGVPHAFQYMFPSIKMGLKWEEDYRAGLRWLLDGAPQ
ncbi:Alpha/Beta hydrolase protein [Mycena capillaripes]|nr:Alpha/Beta hydrolase protein [Mycena capillaripes]